MLIGSLSIKVTVAISYESEPDLIINFKQIILCQNICKKCNCKSDHTQFPLHSIWKVTFVTNFHWIIIIQNKIKFEILNF